MLNFLVPVCLTPVNPESLYKSNLLKSYSSLIWDRLCIMLGEGCIGILQYGGLSVHVCLSMHVHAVILCLYVSMCMCVHQCVWMSRSSCATINVQSVQALAEKCKASVICQNHYVSIYQVMVGVGRVAWKIIANSTVNILSDWMKL